MSIDKMDLFPKSGRRSISPKSPDRAYPYLHRLVLYLEKELKDIPHYYQGGFFIGEYTKEPRYTQDVDLTLVYIDSYEDIKKILASFGEDLVAEGVVSKYLIKDAASERNSGGAKYYALDGSILFSIDIGYHEDALSTNVLTVSDFGEICVTTVEQMLCDKVAALYSDRKFRRVKDLFDAWHLLTSCSINDDKFIQCLVRADIAPLPSSTGPFTEDSIDRMERSFETVTIYGAKDGKEIDKPDFWDIVRVVGDFCCRFSDSEV